MAVIITPDDLSDQLTADFTWRLKEISDLRKLAQAADGIRERAIVRASIPLLYAHWEGYVKISSEKYLTFVANKRRKVKDLSANFLFLSNVRDIHRFVKGSRNVRERIDIVLKIVESSNKTNKDNHSRLINTRSNLNSNVFVELCSIIGIDWTAYQDDFSFIDKIIVDKRNYVAHGGDVSSDLSDFIANSNRILEIMRQFRTDLENSAIAEKYLRRSLS